MFELRAVFCGKWERSLHEKTRQGRFVDSQSAHKGWIGPCPPEQRYNSACETTRICLTGCSLPSTNSRSC